MATIPTGPDERPVEVRHTCCNCHYYDPSEGGLCRRYPPHPSHGLPGVDRRDWCGEWRPESDDDRDDVTPRRKAAP